MGIANSHALASTRSNLFGLNPSAPALYGEDPSTNCQWLEDLGFSVRQSGQKHWVVTHSNPLPELHFYSDSELAQFASYKAQHYARHLLPEHRT